LSARGPRNEATAARRSTRQQRLSVRSNVSSTGRGSGLGASLCRDRGNLAQRRRGCSCGTAARLRRMACHRQAHMPAKLHADLPAFARPGAQPSRERLAVSPPELALKHRSDNYDAIADAACNAWRKLTAESERSHPSECATGLTSVSRHDLWYKWCASASTSLAPLDNRKYCVGSLLAAKFGD
jgi:hypothetical protein